MFIILRRFILLCSLLGLFSSGCGSSGKKIDIHGRWLHKTERHGLDFTPQGLLCHYSHSPQEIRLFRYNQNDSELSLTEFGVKKEDREIVYPFSVEKETLRLQTQANSFKNYRLIKPRDKDETWPALYGLWQPNGSKSDEFLVFTEWNTVFGRKFDDSGVLSPIWAKFEAKKTRSQPSSGTARKLILWGLHGERSLGNLPQRAVVDGNSLTFQETKYVRRTNSDGLELNPSS